MFLFAMALTLNPNVVMCVFLAHAGPKMHGGDQQPPVTREGQSVAAELQGRALSHYKPYDEEAGSGKDVLGNCGELNFRRTLSREDVVSTTWSMNRVVDVQYKFCHLQHISKRTFDSASFHCPRCLLCT